MEITLLPEHEQLINEQIESGLFPSANEVIQASLNLYKCYGPEYEAKMDVLRRELAIGVAQLENGEYTVYSSAEEMATALKASGRALLAKRQAAKP